MFYYFSRFHIEVEYKGDKINFLKQGLKTKPTVEKGNFKYKFFNVTDAIYKDHRTLVGSLVKYDGNAEDDVVDEEKEVIKKVPNANKIVASSRFIVDPENSLIIFNEVVGAISIAAFHDIFKKLFDANHEKDDTMSITTIQEVYSFIEKVKELDVVTRVRIDLVPSNPHFGRWKKIDEKIKAKNLTHLTEIQENKKKGETIIIDEETEDKFYMAEDGYGNGQVTGEVQGQKKQITTTEKGKQIKAAVPAIEMSDEELLNHLEAKKKEILARVKKK